MADTTDKKESTADNSNPSDKTTDEGTEEKSANANLTSPEGILMLFVAIILDVIIGLPLLILSFFGIDDYGMLDIPGIIIIGSWMYFRKGAGGAKEAAKKGLKRFLIALGIEAIPFLGNACPSWTIIVWKELKS